MIREAVAALLLTGSLALPAPLCADDGEPELSAEDWQRLERWETVSRPVPMAGKTQRAGVAVRLVPRDAERVFRAIADPDHWSEWVPFLESSPPAGKAGSGGSRELRFDLPWPLRDRHYRAILRVESSRPAGPSRAGAGREWTLAWTSVPESGNVEWAHGSFFVRDHGEGRALVVFRSATDLGDLGYARTLMNRVMEESLLWVLDGLAQQVGRCRYTVPWPDGCTEERPGRP